MCLLPFQRQPSGMPTLESKGRPQLDIGMNQMQSNVDFRDKLTRAHYEEELLPLDALFQASDR